MICRIETEPKAPSKGERTRAALVEAAVRRFVAEGFARTSLADLARDVGLTPSAVYRYFPDKESLFITAVDSDAAALVELVRETLLEGTEETIAGLLGRLLGRLNAVVALHPLASRVLSGAEAMSPDRIMGLPHLTALRQELADLLRVGQDAGVVRDDIKSDQIALGIETIVMYQLSHLATLQGTEARTDDERAMAIAAVIDSALRPAHVLEARPLSREAPATKPAKKPAKRAPAKKPAAAKGTTRKPSSAKPKPGR